MSDVEFRLTDEEFKANLRARLGDLTPPRKRKMCDEEEFGSPCSSFFLGEFLHSPMKLLGAGERYPKHFKPLYLAHMLMKYGLEDEKACCGGRMQI